MTANQRTSNAVEKIGFEKVFELVGGHGKCQWILMWILSLQLIFLTWNHLGYIFIGAVPTHWCQIELLEKATNWTAAEIKELSLPKTINTNGDQDWKYDSCKYYDRDYDYIATRFGNNYKEAIAYVQGSNSDETKTCAKWNYDNSIYSSTIVTEFDLVCGRRYLAATIQSTYMIGGLVGTFLFGTLNDRVLGRRNSALISIILVLLGGFAATLSQSYWLFVFIRLFIAIGTAGCMQASSLLILEHCDIGSRAKFYSITGAFFGVGYAIMPIYAYFIRDWVMLQLAFSATTLLLLSYFWLFPESPRWLASSGRDEQAVKALEKIARLNGKPKPNKDQLLVLIQSCHKHHGGGDSEGEGRSQFGRKLQSIAYNIKSLLDTREGCKRTLTVWMLFIVVAFVYYGFAFSTNLTSNPYLLVTIGGLMEIPACIVPVPFLSMWGRRPTTAICYFLTGAFAIAIAVTPPEYEMLRIVFTMGGKFFIAAAFNVIYLVIGEVYPTLIRSTGQSAGTIMGRFGSIAAPYVADLLTTVYPDLPCAIFGVVSIFGAGVALMLPEMKDMEMMDQVSELELEKL
ncbi:solute carrier family 22 member 6-B [Folsomia candida]|uniref:Organic cation transporter-like protein n=1 Tax=Folsomia candida TaxID=158441 RepID=A0A226DF42_FOLCA|nr:solute carrier family 22 member 6-B [Folsomia candida]OXA43588.1 Organic cation transporter-like protein [Folsomia candida]